MPPKVQLVLADNADLVTHGISRILQAYPDYRVAATVHSVGELQQRLKVYCGGRSCMIILAG